MSLFCFAKKWHDVFQQKNMMFWLSMWFCQDLVIQKSFFAVPKLEPCFFHHLAANLWMLQPMWLAGSASSDHDAHAAAFSACSIRYWSLAPSLGHENTFVFFLETQKMCEDLPDKWGENIVIFGNMSQRLKDQSNFISTIDPHVSLESVQAASGFFNISFINVLQETDFLSEDCCCCWMLKKGNRKLKMLQDWLDEIRWTKTNRHCTTRPGWRFSDIFGTFFDVTNGAFDTRRSQHIGLDSIVR